MPIVKYVNIATKAYQQACKYGRVTKRAREELFIFIHDWYATVEAENDALENGEETPHEMFQKFMDKLN